jgi:hypothetical protein
MGLSKRRKKRRRHEGALCEGMRANSRRDQLLQLR